MGPLGALHEVIANTAWIDTHEHFVEERQRLSDRAYRFRTFIGRTATVPPDWTALLVDYSLNDLVSAGLPRDSVARLLGEDLAADEKWPLVAPHLARARNTGYLRAVDVTTERLFGLRLSPETCEEIDARMRALRQPGYYERVLRTHAGIERCQVHSLDSDPFCETEYPDLLHQDLSIVPLVCGRHDSVERASGIEIDSLDDYLALIEWCFERFARRAVAVKCAWAYLRPMGVRRVHAPPKAAFELLRAGTATTEQAREVEDFLFDVCVRLATDHGLPVKLHLGYLDSIAQPELRFVHEHVQAAIELAQAYPATTFVTMHMAWPHQEELIAVAKQHPNVVVDLSWAWILAPVAAREFVRRFLTTVPSNKLLCFGGDYVVVENAVGHAALVRAGLEAALTDLVDDGWCSAAEASELAVRVMQSNAEEIFYAS
jgi:hypothetical protein